MDGKKLYKIHVTGRVQGVGFRRTAVNEALSLGITGYVKNLHDGSVYIEAEGSEEQLNAFLVWCNHGTGIGFVARVNSSIYPPANYSDFRIKY